VLDFFARQSLFCAKKGLFIRQPTRNQPPGSQAVFFWTRSLEELAAFIRDWAQVPVEQPIGPDTRFEDDLGITGDDGGALLQAVEKRFAVQLSTIEDGYRKTFGLGKTSTYSTPRGSRFGNSCHLSRYLPLGPSPLETFTMP
jgi:hypothetical protein